GGGPVPLQRLPGRLQALRGGLWARRGSLRRSGPHAGLRALLRHEPEQRVLVRSAGEHGGLWRNCHPGAREHHRGPLPAEGYVRRLYLLACLAIAWAACGDEPVQKVQPSIRVEATHLDEDGSLLLDFGPVPVLLTRT